MTSFAGAAHFASDAMRSTMALCRKGRAVSATPLPSSPSNPQKLWSPALPIVFNNSTGASTPRFLNTLVVAETQSDVLISPNLRNSYVKASSNIQAESSSAVSEGKGEAIAVEPAEEILPDDPAQYELPPTTIAFKMSEEVFRAAKNAEPGSSESYWSHTMYRGPEGPDQKVKVHYCTGKHTTERVIQQFFLDKKIIGFDIEWKSDSNRSMGAKKNVSLIQLATDERVALFHIALYRGDKIEDLVAPSLKKIMEDPSITKVGVAIKADCTRLRKYLEIYSRGLFELSHLYKLVKYSPTKDFKQINKMLVSLAMQAQEHLHLPLFKGEVRGSDWSLPLSMEQIVYAASDSYAGVHLFDVLEIKRNALDPTPPRPYNVEENKPIRIAEGLELPSDEEIELEAEEHEPEPPKKRSYKKLSSAYLAKAKESLELDPDFEISIPEATAPPATTRSKSSPFRSAPEPKDPLVMTATTQADKYRSTHHQNRATPASLRCYFLWYDNSDLSLQDICGLLREDPLKTTTVVNYILEAIKFENLPYEQERLKGVLGLLPIDVVWWRWRALARGCGIAKAD